MSRAVRAQGVRSSRRRRAVWPGLAVALFLTGCPSSGAGADPTPSGRTAGLEVVPSAPVTARPAPGGEPIGPAVTVDLASGGGPAQTALHVSGAGDGSALVLLGPPSPGPAMLLVRVSGDGRRTGSVAVPGLASAWDLHALPDGTALLTGVLAGGDALGYLVVDPATGAARPVATLPLDEATTSVGGGSALAADGRTVWLFSSTLADGRYEHLVTGHDLTAQGPVASRDLFADLRRVHVPHQELDLVGIESTPGGGLVLAVNTFPRGGPGLWAPTILLYDAAVEPLAPPIPVAPPSAGSSTALAVAADGTASVLVRGAASDTLVEMPAPGRRPRPRLEVAGSGATGDLVIDARGRAVFPGRGGAYRIDLATGSTTEVDVGCSGPVTIRDMAASTGGRTWMIGGCFDEGRPPAVLWSID